MAEQVTKTKTKGYRKKTENSYSAFIPFGSDGEFIDMFSGLDLEEEMRLGGHRDVSFSENDGAITVTETYYNAGGTQIYRVVTTLSSGAITSGSGTVTVDLYVGTSTTRKRRKTITVSASGNTNTEELS